MFDHLKQKISDNKQYEPPELSLFWDDIATIEKLVPASLFKPRMKGYTKKAARVLWLQEITNRDVVSYKQLWGKECWFIHEWLSGLSGSEDDQELNQILNWQEFGDWCMENAQKILSFSQVVKKKELAKKKQQRQAQKEAMPF